MDVFEIPSHKSELNVDRDTASILAKLKEARISSKMGPEYIIEHSKAYFAAICYEDAVSLDVIYMAYEDLHRVLKNFLKQLDEILTNLDEETRPYYLNITKLLLYCYVQIIIIVEQKQERKANSSLKKGRVKKDSMEFNLDKQAILVNLNTLMEHEIQNLWHPTMVEEAFINLVSEVAYRFLQNSTIKTAKNVCGELWGFLSTLIKSYSHCKTFIIRTVQLIKMYEHLVQCAPEGFKILVEKFNCKGLVHDFVREVTDCQTNEFYQDNLATRNCSHVLIEMAVLMPEFMIPEVMYLEKYLDYDSAPLRISVLSVITEVLLKVLKKHNLTSEERESRDELITIITEHRADSFAQVRAKVLQLIGRLQEGSALPIKFQNIILEIVVEHLFDKGALVRKQAANCIITFLSFNPYGATLGLEKMRANLEESQKELDVIKSAFDGEKLTELKKQELAWNEKLGDIKEALAEIETSEESIDPPEDISKASSDEDLIKIITSYLNEAKYKEAVLAIKHSQNKVAGCQQLAKTFTDVQEDDPNAVSILLLKCIYLSSKDIGITEETIRQWELLDIRVDFLADCVKFLTLIDTALHNMIELLDSTTVSDMQEAIDFFITAYKFNIDNCSLGIVEMIKLMQRNEQNRKDAVVEAFRNIYLSTEATDINSHTTTIVNRLIELLKFVPVNNLEDLTLIIAEWTARGTMDNAVIDKLWQFFTGKVQCSPSDKLAALDLLAMTARGRRSIIFKNVKLVSSLVLEDPEASKDLRLVASACRILSLASEKIDIDSKVLPFRVQNEDEMFVSLCNIVVDNFLENVSFYNLISDAVRLIYKLSAKPDFLCEAITARILKAIEEKCLTTVPYFIGCRFCQLIGNIAICQLDYMDNTVYKELKRRQNIMDKKKATKGKQKVTNNRKSILDRSVQDAVLNQTTGNDESMAENTQIEDPDAEFILNVLETEIVQGSGLLAQHVSFLQSICQEPDVYNDEELQGCAIIALIRCMLVSSKLCFDNMQLLFTIFEKTQFVNVKCTILYHCSDLLTRFPNIVDPWTPRIFQSLQHPSEQIRTATYFSLANLILRDMIKAHGRISLMAKCLVDKSEKIKSMSIDFFTQLGRKESNLYNILPDIFSHLLEYEELTQADLRYIMKFLFDLVDKSKYLENLVNRFCLKFTLTDNQEHLRNIAYCLSLINFNEKALKNLLENFHMYKNLLHDSDIYDSFKQILTNAGKQQVGKNDLKPLITEIEDQIQNVFKINEGGPPKPKTPTTKTKRRRKPRGSGKRKVRSDSEEDD